MDDKLKSLNEYIKTQFSQILNVPVLLESHSNSILFDEEKKAILIDIIYNLKEGSDQSSYLYEKYNIDFSSIVNNYLNATLLSLNIIIPNFKGRELIEWWVFQRTSLEDKTLKAWYKNTDDEIKLDTIEELVDFVMKIEKDVNLDFDIEFLRFIE